MQNPEEVIRKLLALAKGGTEHEAALAAEKASEIALKYNIDLLGVQQKQDIPNLGDNIVFDSGKRELWIENIIEGLAKLNACKFYMQRHRDEMKYRLIGRPINITTVQLTTEYLASEVKRLNRSHVSDYNYSREERMAYRKDFRLAASRRLRNRLYEKWEALQNRDLPATKNALVVADYFEHEKQAVIKWMEDQGMKLGTARSLSTNLKSVTGIRDGSKAGDKISLNDQLNGANNGVRRIGQSRS